MGASKPQYGITGYHQGTPVVSNDMAAYQAANNPMAYNNQVVRDPKAILDQYQKNMPHFTQISYPQIPDYGVTKKGTSFWKSPVGTFMGAVAGPYGWYELATAK
jgi:hypothetical protein